MHLNRLVLAALLALGLAGMPESVRAEVSEVRISKGYGILYLPLIVMQDQKLLEKQAAKAGLGEVKVNWLLLDGGNIINDAMIAGQLDIAGTGSPGFVTLWAKGRGNAKTEVIGVAGLGATSLFLNTNKPEIKSLRDFKPGDKIALPGIKTSLSAVLLQMAAAKEFGRENYAKLDPLTVGLSHPDGYVALTGGKTEITGHLTSPPFSYLEVQDPKIHRVFNTVDLLGNITMTVVYAPKRFVDANPKIMDAFLAALDEADELIAKDKRQAAEIFVRSIKVKMSEDEVVKMLEDPDTRHSATPKGVMDFADFLHLAGVIKVKPADWKELFIPALHSRQGS
jgi:NitT/TauT family transport system substrate-binding protein